MQQFLNSDPGQKHPPNSFRIMLHLAKALDSIEAILESTANNDSAVEQTWQLLQKPSIKRLICIILSEASLEEGGKL